MAARVPQLTTAYQATASLADLSQTTQEWFDGVPEVGGVEGDAEYLADSVIPEELPETIIANCLAFRPLFNDDLDGMGSTVGSLQPTRKSVFEQGAMDPLPQILYVLQAITKDPRYFLLFIRDYIKKATKNFDVPTAVISKLGGL